MLVVRRVRNTYHSHNHVNSGQVRHTWESVLEGGWLVGWLVNRVITSFSTYVVKDGSAQTIPRAAILIKVAIPQHTDTGPTSRTVESITLSGWHCGHWSQWCGLARV